MHYQTELNTALLKPDMDWARKKPVKQPTAFDAKVHAQLEVRFVHRKALWISADLNGEAYTVDACDEVRDLTCRPLSPLQLYSGLFMFSRL